MANAPRVLGTVLGWLVAACLLLSAVPVRADDALDVRKLAGGITQLPGVSSFEDRTAKLRFEQVSSPSFAPRFQPLLEEASFGFTDSVCWLRFAAENPGARVQPWLLEVPYPHLDHLDLYALHEDGRVEHVVMGDSLPFDRRPVDVPSFVFPQETAPHARIVYYLRAESGGTLRIPVRAWLSNDFLAHESKHDLVLWLFYGAVLIMIFYNFGVAILLRNREYLLHVGLLVSVGGAVFSLSGQTFQFLLPDAPGLANRALAVCMAFGLLFIQLYSLEVIRRFEVLQLVHRVYRYSLPLTLLVLPITLIPKVGLRAVFVLIALYLPFAAYKLYKVYTLGSSQLGFHLLSFAVLAVSIPVAMAAHAKLIPPYPLAIWAAHLGCAGFAVVTALALPARINVMSDRVAGLNVQLSQHVTDLKLALARAEQATQEARRATKVKDEFMATMSHELRTPLNAIINVPQGLLEDFPTVSSVTCCACQEEFLLEPGEQFDAETLCDACHVRGSLRAGLTIVYTGKPARTARFLHKIERAGQHLLQMVNGVLDFSKMEAGHLELALEPLDLKLLLGEVVDQMSDLAARRELTLELSLANGSEPGIGDGLRIRQVLLNLISNAIKFSEPGGQIHVTWERTAEADTLSVRDQGIGIAEEDHERIFASFEQVHKGDTRKYGGTGLGLSISRSLVRMHGGELWVESSLGAGSTFKFSIPRRLSASQSSSRSSAA